MEDQSLSQVGKIQQYIDDSVDEIFEDTCSKIQKKYDISEEDAKNLFFATIKIRNGD